MTNPKDMMELRDSCHANQTSDYLMADREAKYDPTGPDNDVIEKRPSWTRSLDFFVSCLGGSVGLGNVWKFPYLCYKNGGGAFLIPYFILLLLATLPLFIMEVAIGQFMAVGAHKAWGIVPLFQGLGMTAVMIIFYIDCYYNVILAWGVYYLVHSFSSPLPWDSCDGSWNSDHCSTNFRVSMNNSSISSSGNNRVAGSNSSYSSNSIYSNTGSSNATIVSNNKSILADPVTEFWERKVLNLSSGIHDMGTPKWDLTLCLVFAWVLVYLCICKGIKSSGKVMYFTAPAPYVFMVIILIRNATLDGAADGVRYYLTPNMTKLKEFSVWTDAGKQTFFSSCISQGVLLTLGSYNKFNHNFCRDSFLFAMVNSLTSLFAGFLVFTVLGFMAFQQGRPIHEVAESGPGLAFIAYPKAVTQLPLPQFWSVIFFIMIILLGLDSQFLAVEVVTTNFLDQYPSVLRRPYRKEMFIAFVCFVCFLIGLLFVCPGGMYVFQLLDFYTGGKTLLIVGFLDVIAITYVYGIRRFFENMSLMVGRKWVRILYPYLTVCWSVTTPVLCFLLFIMGAINEDELTYSRPNESVYRYPGWAEGIGWMLTASCLVWIPGVAVYRFAKLGFSWRNLQRLRGPLHLEPHQMTQQDRLEIHVNGLEQGVEKPGINLNGIENGVE